MKQILQFLLRAYKRLLSPLLPAACRYVPSCSEYAQEAVARHGAMAGGALVLWRLLRCHPFSRGGLDLVPVSFDLKNRVAEKLSSKTPPFQFGSHFHSTGHSPTSVCAHKPRG